MDHTEISVPPEMAEEEEEVPATPTFEILVRDGRPLTTGSYFIASPRYMAEASWDPGVTNRLLVTACDGTHWYADHVSQQGKANAGLRRID